MRKLLTTLCVLMFLTPSVTSAAIAFDTVTSAGALGASPKTWSHTNTGTDVAIVVCTTQTTSTDNVTGVTYGGQALTKYQYEPPDAGVNYYGQGIWVLLNAPTGANTVSVTTSSGNVGGVSASYSGVLGTVEASTNNRQTTGTTLTTTLTTLTANAWTVLCGSDATSNPVAGSGTTLRLLNQTTLFDSNGGIASPGSTSLIFTYSPSNSAGAVMIALAPTAAAPASVFSFGIYNIQIW